MIDKTQEPFLYVQTAFLGDLALAVPTLKYLRSVDPQRPLWLVCRSGVGDFLLDLKIVDQIFPVKKKDSLSYKTVFDELGQHSFKWIICPHESLTTARWVFTLKAEKKLAFKKWWNWAVYSDRIKKNALWPEAIRQFSLLGLVEPDVLEKIHGTLLLDINHPPLPLPPPPEWSNMALLEEPPENFVAVFPGSVWDTKKWTESGFQALVKKLLEHGFHVELMGSNQEWNECERIKSNLNNVQNFAGQLSLTETIKRIARSKLVISNDSGGSHLGALSGAPVLTIFGPTVIEQGFRPWAKASGAVWLEGLNCRPCGAHGHMKCPLGHHHCMRKLTPEHVFQSALTVSR